MLSIILTKSETMVRPTFREYTIQTKNMTEEEIQEQIDEMMKYTGNLEMEED